MDQLTSMRVFALTAQAGTLSGAARILDMSPAMATKHVGALEARLGVKLLHRTTRKLVLTEAGQAYLEAVQRILAERRHQRWTCRIQPLIGLCHTLVRHDESHFQGMFVRQQQCRRKPLPIPWVGAQDDRTGQTICFLGHQRELGRIAGLLILELEDDRQTERCAREHLPGRMFRRMLWSVAFCQAAYRICFWPAASSRSALCSGVSPHRLALPEALQFLDGVDPRWSRSGSGASCQHQFATGGGSLCLVDSF